jgi:hypothetical protein
MLASTPEKALLRLLWEHASAARTRQPVPLTTLAARLRDLQGDHVDAHMGNGGGHDSVVDGVDLDARVLAKLGLLVYHGTNGDRALELTQVGALLASNLEILAAREH